MDPELLKSLVGLPTGVIIGALALWMSSRQSREDQKALEKKDREYADALLVLNTDAKVRNDRLEHIINTNAMERKASQSELIQTLRDTHTFLQTVNTTVSANSEIMHDVRDILRSGRQSR